MLELTGPSRERGQVWVVVFEMRSGQRLCELQAAEPVCSVLSFFLKDFIYLLLEKRERKKTKRERNINQLPLACPNWGPGQHVN